MILIFLLSPIMMMAEKDIPFWFMEPQDNEYVGISPLFKGTKPVEKMAVISALLNYVISTQNGFQRDSLLPSQTHLETNIDYKIIDRDTIDNQMLVALYIQEDNQSNTKFSIDLSTEGYYYAKRDTIMSKNSKFFLLQLQEGSSIDTCVVYMEKNSFNIGFRQDTILLQMGVFFKNLESIVSNCLNIVKPKKEKLYSQFFSILELSEWDYKCSLIGADMGMNYMEAMLLWFEEKGRRFYSSDPSVSKDKLMRNIANYYTDDTAYCLFGKKDPQRRKRFKYIRNK